MKKMDPIKEFRLLKMKRMYRMNKVPKSLFILRISLTKSKNNFLTKLLN